MAAGPRLLPVAAEIRIRGRVQGVGFRPTVWRIASRLGLDGEVRNDAGGVLIRVCGNAAGIEKLLERLTREPPPLARIDQVERRAFPFPLPSGFRIADSRPGSPGSPGSAETEVSPDAALCAACAAEISDPGARRYRHAFASCTDCGPRLSIVTAIPFDRSRTTMAGFPLCPDCAAEYSDPADRRFHAEAIACPACGPRLALVRLPDRTRLPGDPIATAARLLRDGKIVAVKGLGGYQLACDAGNAAAVARLRRLKQRDRKPFALMARDLATIRRFCTLGREEEQALTGAAAPIVLLRAAGPELLPEAVAPGLATLGFMLPTTPAHLLLMAALDRPAVMTSGNLSDEPPVTDDGEMAGRLAGIAAYALTHDRAIANRVDDSVARVVAGDLRLMRRARGYAPAALELPPGFARAPEILAMGAELKSVFGLVKEGRAVLSQHHGDLEHAAAFDEYRRSLGLYRALLGHRPAALAADRHPEYLSTKLAREEVRATGLKLIEVQHHHAHLAACLAENGYPLSAPRVLGIVMDGLGWGDDGTIWGGEFLLGDYRGYERLAHLAPVAMPGGAQAVREPWRNLYAQLRRTIAWPELARRWRSVDLVACLAAKPLATIDAMIAGRVNSPPASSCGRLFDAVAAALGLCLDRQAYEGEAAMRLEAIVDSESLCTAPGYAFDLSPVAGRDPATHVLGSGDGARRQDADARVKPGQGDLCKPVCVDPKAIWSALLDDLAAGVPAGVIAARFHSGLAEALAATASRLAQPRGIVTVALSGGCFQNAVLLAETERRLAERGLAVLSHAAVPANDGGLALGQAAVAAAQLIEGMG